MDQIIKQINDEIGKIVIISPTCSKEEAQEKYGEKVLFLVPQLTKSTLSQLIHEIRKFRKKNPHIAHILILVDDNTGNKQLHGGRMSQFGNLAAMCRHDLISMICISHQGKAITPTFRNNVTGVIAFPAEEKTEIQFLTDEFGSPLYFTPDTFHSILRHVWQGGKKDKSEWGEHFIYIHKPPRRPIRYFMDFREEIVP